MQRFTSIDLPGLAPPAVVTAPSFEALVDARRQRILARLAELTDDQALIDDVRAVLTGSELEPLVVDNEVGAEIELIHYERVNTAARAVMLAFAKGTDLDHLAARFGIARRLIAAATPTSAAVYEGDAELRRRVQVAPEAFTVAGSAGAYVHHALMADASLSDAVPIAYTTSSGNAAVRVVCLARAGNGVPTNDALAAVRTRLNDKAVRPMTVPVAVTSAIPVDYAVVALLQVAPGPDPALVRDAALASARAMIASRRGLGTDIQRQALEAALRVAGVERVILTSPAADVPLAPDQVANCTSVTLTVEVVDA